MKVALVPVVAEISAGPPVTITALTAVVELELEPTAITPIMLDAPAELVVVTSLAPVCTAIQPGAIAEVVVVNDFVLVVNMRVSQIFVIVLPDPVKTVAKQSTGAVALKGGTPAVSLALAVVAVGALFVPFKHIW